MKEKRSISSFDLSQLATELGSLRDHYVEKIYGPGPGELLLRFNRPGEAKKRLYADLSRFICLTDREVQVPRDPNGFIRLLRKRISNGSVTAVEQHGFDRVLVITIKKDVEYKLVLEMFRKGNAILMSEGRIIHSMRQERAKDRWIAGGKDYRFPESVDPRELDENGIVEVLKGSEKDLVRALAIDLNIGGTYAEEIVSRVGIGKKRPAEELDEGEIGRVLEEVRSVLECLDHPEPMVVVKEGEMVDVIPFPLSMYEDLERTAFDSMNLAVEEFFMGEREVAEEVKAPEGPGPVQETGADPIVEMEERLNAEWAGRIRQQEDAIARYDEEDAASSEVGELIYLHYEECSTAIETVKELMGSGDWGSLQREVDDLITLNEGRGSFTIKVEKEGETRQITLDATRTIDANAADHYERSKKARSKADGARKALERTMTELETLKKRKIKALERSGKMEAVEDEKGAIPKGPFKTRFWFERHRWCISTNGFLLLAGRDAKGNELLVKRHLKPKDRYAHADIHGAPSAVLKRTVEGGDLDPPAMEDPDDQDLEEACAMSAVYSKAWSSRIGGIPGYWVLPEQVSKTPQSGEFLPKGSFVVRGKRNYQHKLPIRLAVGVVEIRGERRLMGGPISAVRQWCDKVVELEPGDTRKEVYAARLAKRFSVTQEEAVRVLPGNVREIA